MMEFGERAGGQRIERVSDIEDMTFHVGKINTHGLLRTGM